MKPSIKSLSRLTVLMLLLAVIVTAASASAEESTPAHPVTFAGKPLPSGAVYRDGIAYISLSEAVDALDKELEHEPGSSQFSFPWRRSTVRVTAGSSELAYLDAVSMLEAPALPSSDGADLLVPAQSFCDGAQIGYLYDAEYDHIYCTPGAGNYDIPKGYNVPVMMYHGVGWGSYSANMFVNPEMLELQFVYLLDHGYTPIWFEDLEHVDEYEKPVLLTFDDGWENIYRNLLPLCEKYGVKVTVFVIWDYFEHSANHLNYDQAVEMYQSGYVSIQSHTLAHRNLADLLPGDWKYELEESRLLITRLIGEEPYALSYPYGESDTILQNYARQYYHFAVKMVSGKPYNTSDDPMAIYRFFPEKWTPIDTYIRWLELAFPPQ